MHRIEISNRYLKRYFKRTLKRSIRAIALRAWPSSHEVNAKPQVVVEDLEVPERHVPQVELPACRQNRDLIRQTQTRTSPRQGDFHQHECDVYRGDECMIRGASLQQAAQLLNIDMFELAVTILKYERCKVGEFSVVPSAAAQDASDYG
jgi:hypothetical protein